MKFLMPSIATVLVASIVAVPPVSATEIMYRSFSGAAAIGPPADDFAAKLESITATALGPSETVRLTKMSPRPAIPPQFKGDILAAVGAGEFDAAYVAGHSLNEDWGFVYNSGVPFGPNFDEFLGFLYGNSVEHGTMSGLELAQGILDDRGHNVKVIPIVGSSQQGSGYFMAPVGDTDSDDDIDEDIDDGIGLAGLCEQDWTFRYLPPAEHVLDLACDNLVKAGEIPQKNIDFVAAVAGGQIIDKVIAGEVQAFEFATPLDDESVLFADPAGNPGTVGARYLHYPGWHQPFLVTYLIINKDVWDTLSEAQRTLVMTVARDHVTSSYGENLRQQGGALQRILDANTGDQKIVLVRWPDSDLELLKDATIEFLNYREKDITGRQHRGDYKAVLDAFREYVGGNNGYWKRRDVPSTSRFVGWEGKRGNGSWDQVFD